MSDSPDQQLVLLGAEIARAWELPESAPAAEDELLRRLAARILELLDGDMGALMQILYRIDVPEARFNEAMAAASQQERAERLARLCIERERLKIKTRELYRRRGSADAPNGPDGPEL